MNLYADFRKCFLYAFNGGTKFYSVDIFPIFWGKLLLISAAR